MTLAPAAWQSSAAGRGRSGCRPCCGAKLSALRPECSPWTRSPTPSARGREAAAESDWKSSIRAGFGNSCPFAHLDDDLQRVEDDDVGLCGQVAVDKSFVLQLGPSPSMT